jgi:hypothetical protein
MSASPSPDPAGDPRGVIARLSHALQVPLQEVREIYGMQLQRLGVEARVRNFLAVLALRNTRDILRADERRAALRSPHAPGESGCHRESPVSRQRPHMTSLRESRRRFAKPKK